MFFDFLPLSLGEIRGFKTRFHLYTVPGQVFYDASRKLILKGVDGVVFVGDSQMERMEANIESLENLRTNLQEQGYDLDKLPYVVQYNKRDLPNAIPMAELEEALNPTKVPSFEAVAPKGVGVFDTLKAVAKLVLTELRKGGMMQTADVDATGRDSVRTWSPSRSKSRARGSSTSIDPDSGNVFRFYEVEYSLACAMDGERDVAGIVKWAEEELGLDAVADRGPDRDLDALGSPLRPDRSRGRQGHEGRGDHGRGPAGRGRRRAGPGHRRRSAGPGGASRRRMSSSVAPAAWRSPPRHRARSSPVAISSSAHQARPRSPPPRGPRSRTSGSVPRARPPSRRRSPPTFRSISRITWRSSQTT